jgi:hypothetical protein
VRTAVPHQPSSSMRPMTVGIDIAAMLQRSGATNAAALRERRQDQLTRRRMRVLTSLT